MYNGVNYGDYMDIESKSIFKVGDKVVITAMYYENFHGTIINLSAYDKAKSPYYVEYIDAEESNVERRFFSTKELRYLTPLEELL